jgi:hypothetical protein
MRLRVEHEDGRIETLTLDGDVRLQHGRVLDRLVTEEGAEHFFTKEGYYDGWGRAVLPPDAATPNGGRVKRPALQCTDVMCSKKHDARPDADHGEE